MSKKARVTGVLLWAAASAGWGQVVPIHGVQGTGPRSPLEGQVVTTRGVVTGVKGNGFFLQTPAAEEDGNPATSEGLFVFTGGPPPAAVQVGALVAARGKVLEYSPSADPFCPPLTELAESPSITVLATGQPLPPPVELTPALLNPAGGLEQLEPLEGMRVRVASLTVVGPTGGTHNERTGLVVSNGLLWGVLTGTGRPFREAGLEAPEPLPAVPCCVPRFDANPERLAVDSDALLGTQPLDLPVGAVVQGLVGPLDYTCRAYMLLPEPGAAPAVALPSPPPPLPPAGPLELAVATWNLQRFFDPVDDPDLNEPVPTPEVWARRLRRTARVVVSSLRLPDLLALQEVENLNALEALARAANEEALSRGLPDPRYRGILLEGNDVGGIDVAFLVKAARVEVVEVRQEGKEELFSLDRTPLHDRPPLVLRARVTLPGGGRWSLTAIAVHLRSLTDIAHPERGPRVRAKRQEQAESLARIITRARQRGDGEPLMVLGDFNAFEVNDGYADVLGTVAGRPAPADQVVVQVSPRLVDPPLEVLTPRMPPEERYTYVYRGNAQALDHILVSGELAGLVRRVAAVRLSADFPEVWRGDDAQLRRLSDHDPVVLHLGLPAGPPRLRGVVRSPR